MYRITTPKGRVPSKLPFQHKVLHQFQFGPIGVKIHQQGQRWWQRRGTQWLGKGPVLSSWTNRGHDQNPTFKTFLSTPPYNGALTQLGQVKRSLNRRDVNNVIKDLEPRTCSPTFERPEKLAKYLGFTTMDLTYDPYTYANQYQPSNPVAHPGFTCGAQGNRNKAEANPMAVKVAREVLDDILIHNKVPKKSILLPATRARIVDLMDEQRTGIRKAGRLVVMCEAWEPILGGEIVFKIMEQVSKKQDHPIACKFNWLAGRGDEFFERCTRNGNEGDTGMFRYTCLDVTEWDRSLRKRILTYASEVVAFAFQPEDRWKVKRVLRFMVEEIASGTMLFPDGNLYIPGGGMKSGSILTTLWNTIINIAVMRETIKLSGLDKRDFRLMAGGDDSVIINTRPDKGKLELDKLDHIYSNTFGLTLSLSKCRQLDHVAQRFDGDVGVNFLGYELDKQHNPWRPASKTVQQLLLPDKISKNVVEEWACIIAAGITNPFNDAAVAIVTGYARYFGNKRFDNGLLYSTLLPERTKSLLFSGGFKNLYDYGGLDGITCVLSKRRSVEVFGDGRVKRLRIQSLFL